jgi:serine O-acetyltransferase
MEETMTNTFAQELLKIRHTHVSILPSKQKVQQFADDLIELLFPHFCGEYEYFAPKEIEGKLALLERDLKKILKSQQPEKAKAVDKITAEFFSKVPELYRKLRLDAIAIHEGDPASESVDEVISAYPGFYAIYTYRIAHEFYLQGIPIFPRMLSEYAHYRTGIDINPGARIGESFFIDHGTGIVVGETTIIGNRVKLYQGVSLGALSVSKSMSKLKRHPTIEDDVIIYSNATILGGKTVIGHDSVIGGNVWLTEGVPPYSVVFNKIEVKVRSKKNHREQIDFII